MKSYIFFSSLFCALLVITPTHGMHQRDGHNADTDDNALVESISNQLSTHVQRLDIQNLMGTMPNLIGNAIITSSITRMIGDPTSTMLERALDPVLPAANSGMPAVIINQTQNYLISSRISSGLGAQLVSPPPACSIQQMLAQMGIQIATGYAVNWVASALLKQWHKGTIKPVVICRTLPSEVQIANFIESALGASTITFTSEGARNVCGRYSQDYYDIEPDNDYHCRIYQKDEAIEVLEALPFKYCSAAIIFKSHYTNPECERTYPRLYGFSDAIHRLKRAVLEKHTTLIGKTLKEIIIENPVNN